MTSLPATAAVGGWIGGTTPAIERARLAVVKQMRLLDTVPDEVYTELAVQAATLLHMPAAFLTLVSGDRIWFLAKYGNTAAEMPRTRGFCASVIISEEPLVVLDTHKDEGSYPDVLRQGAPFVRFFASAPLIVKEQAVGTLCVMDTKPHESFTRVQLSILQNLAKVAGSLMADRIHP